MSLTHFERFRRAVELQEPDRVPYGFGIGGEAYLKKLTGLPYQELFRGDGTRLAAAMLAFQKKFDTDYVISMSDPFALVEGYGQKLEFRDAVMSSGPVIKDPAEWDKLQPLNPKKDAGMPTLIEAVRLCKEKVGDEIPVGSFIFTPTSTLMSLRGAEDYLMELLTSPESNEHPMQVVSETSIEFGEELYDAGADFIFYLPHASADYFTLEMYEELHLPWDLKIVKELEKIGFPYIGIHTCQRNVFFDLLFENMGGVIDMWNWWYKGPHGMDMKKAKEKFGKELCLVSGLDQVKNLVSGTKSDIENEVQQSIKDAAAGGGLVLSPGCALSLLTSAENLDIACNAAKMYGKYPIAI